jgi:hypothetical protein
VPEVDQDSRGAALALHLLAADGTAVRADLEIAEGSARD